MTHNKSLWTGVEAQKCASHLKGPRQLKFLTSLNLVPFGCFLGKQNLSSNKLVQIRFEILENETYKIVSKCWLNQDENLEFLYSEQKKVLLQTLQSKPWIYLFQTFSNLLELIVDLYCLSLNTRVSALEVQRFNLINQGFYKSYRRKKYS